MHEQIARYSTIVFFVKPGYKTIIACTCVISLPPFPKTLEEETRLESMHISCHRRYGTTGSQQTLSSTVLFKSPKNVNFNKTFPRTYQQKKNSFLDEKKGQHCTIWFWNSYEVYPFPPVFSYNSKYLFPLKDTIQNTHSGYRPVSSTLAPALACRPHNIGSPRFDVTL